MGREEVKPADGYSSQLPVQSTVCTVYNGCEYVKYGYSSQLLVHLTVCTVYKGVNV